jgi:transposase
MFIREVKTTNKNTGEVYVKHKLVESVRTDKGPRQRTIMELGRLTVPRVDWKRLAHALECRTTGQQSFLDESDQEIERLALSLASNNKLSKHLAAGGGKGPSGGGERQYARIDMGSVKTKETRSVGPELLCMRAWEALGLGGVLKGLGSAPKLAAAAAALVFGRMVSPGSERHTVEWFRKRSALQELPGLADISGCGKDLFYEAGDWLYAHKEATEDMLYHKEREHFPHTGSAVYLYDITNTYMEGSALGNVLAARGHCKSKRFDCPLVTLSLVVGDDGMPITSQIYKGNQSEPETMEGMMGRLSRRLHGSQIPLFKPTVVMDRGVATDANAAWLQGNGYHYIVIKRGEAREGYRRQFEEGPGSFEAVGGGRGAYGDENKVYIRKELVDGTMCSVLCISEGRERKERAVDEGKEKPFLEDIENFRRSIAKGTIKNQGKIAAKLERITAKHAKTSSRYEASLVKTEGKATGVALAKKEAEEEKLFGCYVIESSHVGLAGADIWRLYMTLTRVESAFRSMKDALGARPVYHQTGDRTAAHLFVTVLAYHLLATLENFLAREGDTRSWPTLRDVMSTLTRGTVMMRDDQGSTYNIRVTGEPEDVQQAILDKLGISQSLKTFVTKI